VQIHVAGEGPLRPRITDFVEQHQLRNLTYHGKLDLRELARLYAVCDIGLCPYAPESNVGMPDKAYDYMAVGLPIVNSLRGELETFLRDQHIGVQYIAGDSHSLAVALDGLAADTEKRLRMARNSYDAAAQFDQHLQYGRMADFMEEVVRNLTLRI